MPRAMMVTALLILGCAACATAGKVPTDTRLEEARQAFNEGLRLKEAGRYAEAVPPLERARELREAVLGERHLEVGACLDLLGTVHQRQGNYAQAATLHQRALAIREAALGKSHPDVATTLHNLATLDLLQGNYAQAGPLFERALALREAALGKSHPDVAATLHNLGTLHFRQGNLSQAERSFERALAIREAAFGENHSDVAGSLNNLAAVYTGQGNYTRAGPLLERALAIQEALLGERHSSVAVMVDNLANYYFSLGDYARAKPLFERALALRRTAHGESHHWDIAASLNNLAALDYRQGNYARAEPLYERALTILEEALGKDHPDLGTPLNNLAVLYLDQGNYTRAMPLHERALAIREKAFGETNPEVAQSLQNIAELHYRQGNLAQAEPLFERALAILEGAHGKDHPDIATLLSNMANLHLAQGRYTRAEPLFERALAIREKTLDKAHPAIGLALHHLANFRFRQGNPARAEPLFERAIALQEAALGKNHPDLVTSLNSFALLRLAQQRTSEAVVLFERAFTASEAHLRQEVFGYSAARLAGFLQLLRAQEETLDALGRRYPDDARIRHLVLSAALLRKGRSIEELSQTSRIIYRSLGQADRETFGDLRALRTRFANLSLNGPGSQPLAQYQQGLKALADQSDAMEADLARRSAPLRALYALPPPAELIDRVAASLPKDGALIEFIAYRDRPLVPQPGTPPASPPGQLRYLALLLFADGRTHAVDLGPAAPMDAAVLRLHQALDRDLAAYQAASQNLYQRVFHRLVPLLGKVRRLFLSPDGQLALVPFDALHDGRRFLVDGWDIAYLTSGKDLLRRPEDSPPGRSIVVLADPDFDSRPPVTSSQGEGSSALDEPPAVLERFYSVRQAALADRPWPPLPGTRKEAELIKRLLPQAELRLGRDATKEALLELDAPGVLHIATHGFFLEDAAPLENTRAVGHFGAVGEPGPAQRPPDPLLRSGLVLAGARAPEARSDDPPSPDALVTALEVSGLNLWGTQLVVLSACDTGRGEIKLGQGVYGLRRALVVAGAETLVTSLWKVNDETTRQLMEDYYHNLLAGQGRAAALREAMRKLRQKQPHPRAWAPFIAIGQDTPLRGLDTGS